ARDLSSRRHTWHGHYNNDNAEPALSQGTPAEPLKSPRSPLSVASLLENITAQATLSAACTQQLNQNHGHRMMSLGMKSPRAFNSPSWREPYRRVPSHYMEQPSPTAEYRNQAGLQTHTSLTEYVRASKSPTLNSAQPHSTPSGHSLLVKPNSLSKEHMSSHHPYSPGRVTALIQAPCKHMSPLPTLTLPPVANQLPATSLQAGQTGGYDSTNIVSSLTLHLTEDKPMVAFTGWDLMTTHRTRSSQESEIGGGGSQSMDNPTPRLAVAPHNMFKVPHQDTEALAQTSAKIPATVISPPVQLVEASEDHHLQSCNLVLPEFSLNLAAGPEASQGGSRMSRNRHHREPSLSLAFGHQPAELSLSMLRHDIGSSCDVRNQPCMNSIIQGVENSFTVLNEAAVCVANTSERDLVGQSLSSHSLNQSLSPHSSLKQSPLDSVIPPAVSSSSSPNIKGKKPLQLPRFKLDLSGMGETVQKVVAEQELDQRKKGSCYTTTNPALLDRACRTVTPAADGPFKVSLEQDAAAAAAPQKEMPEVMAASSENVTIILESSAKLHGNNASPGYDLSCLHGNNHSPGHDLSYLQLPISKDTSSCGASVVAGKEPSSSVHLVHHTLPPASCYAANDLRKQELRHDSATDDLRKQELRHDSATNDLRKQDLRHDSATNELRKQELRHDSAATALCSESRDGKGQCPEAAGSAECIATTTLLSQVAGSNVNMFHPSAGSQMIAAATDLILLPLALPSREQAAAYNGHTIGAAEVLLPPPRAEDVLLNQMLPASSPEPRRRRASYCPAATRIFQASLNEVMLQQVRAEAVKGHNLIEQEYGPEHHQQRQQVDLSTMKQQQQQQVLSMKQQQDYGRIGRLMMSGNVTWRDQPAGDITSGDDGQADNSNSWSIMRASLDIVRQAKDIVVAHNGIDVVGSNAPVVDIGSMRVSLDCRLRQVARGMRPTGLLNLKRGNSNTALQQLHGGDRGDANMLMTSQVFTNTTTAPKEFIQTTSSSSNVVCHDDDDDDEPSFLLLATACWENSDDVKQDDIQTCHDQG
ncbi:hypothetical protein CEUSTIGMA_g5433.t1, partial [Chlamydomonas eustigma]